jgi:hypothetical protein
MDVSFLSLIDLLRNISLAVFAISTWYIAQEEKRARVLFDLSLSPEDKAVYGLSEAIIELRDKKGIRERLGEQISSRDVERLERKIEKLKKLDNARNLSITMFSSFVIIEILVFAYCYLLAFFN